jgi:hypothetical protein
MVFAWGCSTHQRYQTIDTDKLDGFASGEFKDTSQGPVARVQFGASGAGSGVNFGFGAAWLDLTTGPPPTGAKDFARAIATINYSKRLKSIKYDEVGNIIEYEFEPRPISALKSNFTPPAVAPSRPRTSFGHQPIE